MAKRCCVLHAPFPLDFQLDIDKFRKLNNEETLLKRTLSKVLHYSSNLSSRVLMFFLQTSSKSFSLILLVVKAVLFNFR